MRKGVFLQIFLVSVCIFVFTYFFLSLFLYSFNAEFLYFLKDSKWDKVNKDLIVVEIDNLSYSKLGYPIERWDYVPFLENLNESKPAVIWFDILFLDRWKDIKQDLSFAKKIKELWNVVLWFDIQNQLNVIMPYKLFYEWTKWVWYFQPFVNLNTQKVSSIEPFKQLNYNWENKYFESFSLSVLRSYYNIIFNTKEEDIKPNIEKWKYSFFWKNIPIQKSLIKDRKINEFIINYSSTNLFQRESFYNIYSWNFDKSKFKDKIVLIWFTAEWVKDDFYLPWLWLTKWVYIHANAINNILNENFIVYFNKNLELIISFLFIFSLIYINVIYLKVVSLKWISFWAIFLFIFISVLYFIFFVISYKTSWVYLLPNFPFQFLAVLFLSFFASSILKYLTEDKNKRLLSKALSEYVSWDIAREILTSSGHVKLEWERKKISIFFSDIAWFTTISEKMSPEDLVSFLKRYLWEMSDIIMDNKWFINKYEWDAIMALWWVFNKEENHWVIDACNSAILQQKALTFLNEEFEKEWIWKIWVRMWIHTWDAIIWNIWSTWRKMEFTALWDSVNLASRLEWVNKYYNTNICVSESVYEIWKELFEFRFMDKIKVKWKNMSVNIYELVWKKWEVSDLKLQIINDFQKGLDLYFDKEFEKAKELFINLKNLWDKPSEIFAHRCEVYLQQWVWENWDWVWTMKDK